MPAILDRLLRIGEGKILRQLEAIAKAVNAIEDDFVKMSDAELQGMTAEFKARLEKGETLDDLMPEAFATVREASKRVIGQRHYDVQIMGGAALHLGNIAEMKTGEGKTLVATLPSYLNALNGKGVHVVTVNDYLAKYHAEWMGRIHHFLGLTTGVILPAMRPDERRVAYNCDITYGTNNELGFDYLRDNMASTIEDCVQRGHPFAVVDEVDSILIDEARTPLIISGPTQDEVRWYAEFAKIAKTLDRDVRLRGRREEAHHLGARARHHQGRGPPRHREPLRVGQHPAHLVPAQLHQGQGAVPQRQGVRRHRGRGAHRRRAHRPHARRAPLQRRPAPGDRGQGGSDGPRGVPDARHRHPPELLPPLREALRHDRHGHDRGLASSTRSTSSAWSRSRPTCRWSAWTSADLVYRTEEAKYDAVVEDIAERHAKGQPILVGTVSVEKSEHLSGKLKQARRRAHGPQRQAARRRGQGRRDGRPQGRRHGGHQHGRPRYRHHARRLGRLPRRRRAAQAGPRPVRGRRRLRDRLARDGREDQGPGRATSTTRCKALGGLYVVGTERHESRRIDNQLRGRSGRQGDPGESRFYLSLEDELMRLFKSDWVDRVLQVLKIPDDVPIENKRVTGAIANAQGQIESQNFESRKNVLKYDDVMDRQRHVIYDERRRVLEGADLKDQISTFVDDVVTGFVTGATQGFAEEWDLDGLWTELKQLWPVGLDLDVLEKQAGGLANIDRDELIEALKADAHEAYARREDEVGEEVMRELERRVILSVLDRKWREHLYEMDYLREGIYLRAYSQRDPLVEYQREGFDMFAAVMDGIKAESVGFLFNLDVQVEEDDDEDASRRSSSRCAPRSPTPGLGSSRPARTTTRWRRLPPRSSRSRVRRAARRRGSGPRASTGRSSRRTCRTPRRPSRARSRWPRRRPSGSDDEFSDVGRNQLCPCGSGKKYKRCHGAPGGPTGLTARVS